MSGISGKDLDVVGTTVLNIVIGDCNKNLHFIVINDTDVCILGMQGMAECKVIIDVAANTIMCDGLTLQFDNCRQEMGKRVTVSVVNEEEREKCNLRLRDTVLIPANTKRICPVDVFKDQVTSAECVVDCSFGESRYGLVIPPTVCLSDKTIYIVIYNPNTYPVKLKARCMLGCVSETLVQETENTVELLSDETTTSSPDNHPLDKLQINPNLTKS